MTSAMRPSETKREKEKKTGQWQKIKWSEKGRKS